MREYYGIIMAGGGGTRFWPASRRSRPKQFLAILGEDPLITQTARRLEKSCPPERVLVITNELQAAGTQERVPELPEANIVAEPQGRNTAPCIGLAALLCRHRAGGEALLGIFPADAYITPEEAFTRTLGVALEVAAAEEGIVTIGIPPDRAATGYGYIQAGAAVPGAELPCHRVARFTEKPDPATAQRFLDEGGYAWNAGIFVARAEVILAELARQQPEIHALLEELEPHLGSEIEQQKLQSVYERMPSISFDYAVMENAGEVFTVEAAFTWDDLGSWAALARHEEPDENGNLVRGEAIAVEATGNTVQSRRPVALVGVEDLIVVETEDALLVCRRDRAEKVKQVVQRLEEEGREDLL